MTDHLNGVAAKIQQDEPRAHFVHCVAHSLNLWLQQSGKQSKSIRYSLALVTMNCVILSKYPPSAYHCLNVCNLSFLLVYFP